MLWHHSIELRPDFRANDLNNEANESKNLMKYVLVIDYKQLHGIFGHHVRSENVVIQASGPSKVHKSSTLSWRPTFLCNLD